MSSTHLSLHYHLVFSTKERRELIADEWREKLRAYLGGCIRTAVGIPEIVGGTRDHVHLLIGLKATHRLADVVRDIKANSSAWIKREFNAMLFSWQDGYGAFTVSPTNIENVRRYIANQPEHHAKTDYKNEYVKLLKLSKADYDERFLW